MVPVHTQLMNYRLCVLVSGAVCRELICAIVWVNFEIQHLALKKAVVLHKFNCMAATPGNEKKEGGVKPYLKYSGLAFQMIGVMVLAAWLGMKLDEHFATQNPWFTIVLLVVAVVASMVLVIVSLNKK